MKLWGGRFSKETDKLVEDFHSSISFDKRLYKQDIRGSIAHARMLGKCGIISTDEAEQIISGLEAILQELEEGKLELSLGHDAAACAKGIIHFYKPKLITGPDNKLLTKSA